MRTGTLGRAFESTAASYKFFWFLALLRLLPRHETLLVSSVVREMIVIAWTPAALFRLSFGPHDRLQDAVRDLQEACRLRPTTTETRVRAALARWPEAGARIDALSQLVPSRFLGPWLELGLSPTIRDNRRTRAIVRTARETISEVDGPPYELNPSENGVELAFGPGWRDWLLNHQLILQGHTEFALARFLQARNPHVPGIPDKVRTPGGRKLAPARRMFELLRSRTGALYDAYDDGPLGDSYAVDHVLPRSFVAHDLLWNLVPTSLETNRHKGEALPAEALLLKIARYHFSIVAAAPRGATEIEDYIAVFGASEKELRAPGKGFCRALSSYPVAARAGCGGARLPLRLAAGGSRRSPAEGCSSISIVSGTGNRRHTLPDQPGPVLLKTLTQAGMVRPCC